MFRIRLAGIDDLQTYFNWVNDEEVRKNSLNSNKVDFDVHKKWFLEKINSNQSFLLVLEKNNNPIGQIRFDNYEQKTSIDYSISSYHRKKGLGEILLKLGTDFYIKNRLNNKINIITAEVKKTNLASIRIFEKNGFTKFFQNKSETILFKKQI